MLDTFLELGVSTRDIAAAFEEFQTLGFSAIDVGDIRDHGYAVVSDGGICLALHENELTGPWLSFVRPNLQSYVRALRRRSIEIEFANLGEQEFHELGFRDPNGQLVTLLEARTFSAGGFENVAASICGTFLEYSIATASIEESARFWEALGFTTVAEGSEPHAWQRICGAGLTIGLHESLLFRPGLTYSAGQIGARIEYLRAKGCDVRLGAPVLPDQRPSATLNLPVDLPIYLLEDRESAD